MVDGHGEDAARGVLFERLGQHRSVVVVIEPVVDARVENREFAHRHHASRLVDECHADDIGADGARCDVVVRACANHVVEGSDERRRGHVGVMVLDLDEAHHIGIDRRQCGHDLRLLTRELFLGVSAAALLILEWATDIAGAREGREVVEDVEACDRQAATDVVGRLGSPVDGHVVSALRRLHAVQAEGVIHDAGHVGDRVASAESVLEGERVPVRMPGPLWVWSRQAVIQRDAIQEVLLRKVGARLGARLVHRRRLEVAVDRQDDLAESVVVEELADGQSLWEGDKHALVALEVRERLHGKRHRRGHGQGETAGADHDAADGGQLRHAGLAVGREVSDRADDPNVIADGDIRRTRRKDEDPFRGRRIGVRLRILLLDVEPVQLTVIRRAVVLEVADDDALDEGLRPRERTERTAALDLMDRRRWVAALSRRRRREDLVRSPGCVVGLALLDRSGEPGDAGEVEVVADPVGRRVRVGPVGDARRAARSEDKPVVCHAE